MERHDRQAAAGGQHLLGSGEAALEFAQFVVHRDAQRLEGARGGIALVPALRPDRAAHDLGQLTGALDALGAACLDDVARDATAAALLAVTPDDVGELCFVGVVHQIGRRLPVLLHAHVERTGGTEGKAAVGLVELHRRDTEIERDAVDILDAFGRQELGHVAEAALDQTQARRIALGQHLASRNRVGITVDGDHLAIRTIEHRGRVAARAERAIEVTPAVARLQRIDDLAHHHRDVASAGHASPPLSPRTNAAIFSRSASRRACQRAGFQSWNFSTLPTSMTPSVASSA